MNLTDEQIIKALECCRDCKCKDCPCYNKEADGCKELDEQDILDLINRKDAEIERLQHEILSCNTKIQVLQEVKEQLEKDVFNAQMNCDSIAYEYELLKQEKTVVQLEAIKEFAEKLKCRSHRFKTIDRIFVDCIPLDYIDNLVKEMVGE